MSYKRSKYFTTSFKRKIKYLYIKKNSQITVVFFHGFMSDMIGAKPTAIQKFCGKQKLSFLKFEYSGHGKSTGKFTEGNISKWTNDAKQLIRSKIKKDKNSKSMILPGVGSFKNGMNLLKKKRLVLPIRNFFKSGRPILGICLGMQLFFNKSQEFGTTQGLGIINAKVKKFSESKNSNLPNIGWSNICSRKKKFDSPLLSNIKTNESFYLVHSYYIEKFKKKNHTVEFAKNGDVNFCTFVNYKNLYLVQFHPEKSGQEGLKIYSNFKKLIKK